ncbi:hypothetical protein [Parabacteroides sp. Marseille-P3160]|uniref:hypothetical protein n=1 Tax=Parabacteroides sp. Marseille-P3160 TaxID=1917887 RepID=UPI0009BA8826|nr:hypothetical protein [Parabacteroides sp. Marseille-P3160]
MNAAELYRLMDDPALLTEQTLPELKQIVEDFPYFHTARMLYLKNLALLKDVRFSVELKKMAIHLPDRRKLFFLIEGDKYGLLKNWPEEKSNSAGVFALIDSFLESRDSGKSAEAGLLFQPSVSSDYIYWTLSEKKVPETSPQEPEVKFQRQELIDSFIEEEKTRQEKRTLPESAELGKESSDEEDETSGAGGLDDSFFTETLAHIYVKQKRYEKALQIIKNLYLKYPEKNVYFADQIRFLEKLIINSKKTE